MIYEHWLLKGAEGWGEGAQTKSIHTKEVWILCGTTQ